MKPEEQRIAIAKACGWRLRWQNMGGGVLFDAKPRGHYWEVWSPPTFRYSRDPDETIEPPDYLNDLNAMHEAEKVLTPKQRDSYFWELLEATSYCGLVIDGLDGNNGGFEFISMSAPQRAEAFLRTLNLYTP